MFLFNFCVFLPCGYRSVDMASTRELSLTRRRRYRRTVHTAMSPCSTRKVVTTPQLGCTEAARRHGRQNTRKHKLNSGDGFSA